MNQLTYDSRPPAVLDVARDVVRDVLESSIDSIVLQGDSFVPATPEVVTDLVVASRLASKFPGLSALVKLGAKDLEKKNTLRCYKPKQFKFLQFCESVYHQDVQPKLVTEDKVFTFLFYQAYRQKRTNRLRISTTDSQLVRFERASFDDVIERYTDFVRIDEQKIDVGNVVGYDCVNQYLCSVRHISDEQYEYGKNKLLSSEIMSI